MAKIAANELRAGMLIRHAGRMWRVLKSAHVRIGGRGGACMQVEMRGVKDASKVNQRFRTDEKIERPFVDRRPMQYLYQEGGKHVFMDLETYDQCEVEGDLVKGIEGYLLPNLDVIIAELEGESMAIELPVSVELEITETEPHIKGATATSSYKPATVTTGITVMVPPFITTGETVRVSTSTGEYLERAN